MARTSAGGDLLKEDFLSSIVSAVSTAKENDIEAALEVSHTLISSYGSGASALRKGKGNSIAISLAEGDFGEAIADIYNDNPAAQAAIERYIGRYMDLDKTESSRLSARGGEGDSRQGQDEPTAAPSEPSAASVETANPARPSGRTALPSRKPLKTTRE